MTATDDTTLLEVPPKLKSAEAQPLHEMLADRRGRPVALDFAAVTQLGTQCLQVLAAAHQTWQAEGTPFEIRNMSDEIRDGLLPCGLQPAQIGAKEAQHDA
ncbi:STAS domain-containing protein [Psychromarinibacter sp. C21-152]|uniref:STAS domain-containing protein n=1 Tax=Psychromarinibacter sediminicola TaxID=3033385 RepID=A0AAE3T788_9RHOB|nr:STAS domain-containing protein [Psychromarinibacter sediminicola]MDF0600067.1 STAS domain-containing protein [Psychromarinibacter sediminicola]